MVRLGYNVEPVIHVEKYKGSRQVRNLYIFLFSILIMIDVEALAANIENEMIALDKQITNTNNQKNLDYLRGKFDGLQEIAEAIRKC